MGSAEVEIEMSPEAGIFSMEGVRRNIYPDARAGILYTPKAKLGGGCMHALNANTAHIVGYTTHQISSSQ